MAMITGAQVKFNEDGTVEITGTSTVPTTEPFVMLIGADKNTAIINGVQTVAKDVPNTSPTTTTNFETTTETTTATTSATASAGKTFVSIFFGQVALILLLFFTCFFSRKYR